MASRQPRNPVGWLMLAIAASTGLSAFAIYLTKRAFLVGVSPTGAIRWSVLAINETNGIGLGVLVLVLLLFPTGTPLNPRIVETQLSGAAVMQLGFNALAQNSRHLSQ